MGLICIGGHSVIVVPKYHLLRRFIAIIVLAIRFHLTRFTWTRVRITRTLARFKTFVVGFPQMIG